MSITIRTSSRISENVDTNNNTENVNTHNATERHVTAADRAARRAKRAQRLAVQAQPTESPTESPNATNGVSDEACVVTLNANKSEPVTLNIKKSAEIVRAVKLSNGNPTEDKNKPVKEGVAVNVLSNALSNMMSGEKKSEVKPLPGSSVRGRINTWSQTSTPPKPALKYGAAAGANKFQFGVDYNTKKANTAASSVAPVPGRAAAFKYTPTVNRNPRPPSSGFTPSTRTNSGLHNTGRFQGIQKDEPAAPAFGGSATDRMAQFREAMEKEKAQKAREEERKKQAEERKKETLEKRKQEEENRKQEELEKKKEEEKKSLEAKAEEEEKNAVPDSEKIKHVPACAKRKEKKPARRTMSISNIVIDWVQEMTKDYPVEIRNFSSSWNNGMAFCALIHRFNPEEFDFNELKPENKRYNFDLAFNTGLKCKNIPILLDTEDMVRMARPEPRSVQCYIQWIWSVYGPTSGYGPTPQEVQNATMS